MQFYWKYAKPLFSSIKYFMWGSHAWSRDGCRECGILDHLSASSPKQVWLALPFVGKAWKYALLMCSLVPHQKSTFRLRFYDSLRSLVLNHWRIQVFFREGGSRTGLSGRILTASVAYAEIFLVGFHSVAYGGYFYLVCVVCDVRIWRHIHVSKPTF